MKTLIITLICCLVTVSKVASQCCDFQVTMCDWQNTGFQLAPTETPNTASYPNFIPTEPSPYYMWLQNNSLTATTQTVFYIADSGSIITFDIFFNSPIVGSISTVYVYFNNIDTGTINPIYIGDALTEIWQHHDITCDASNYYCCGLGSTVPCYGTLQISVYLDPTYRLGLFAVDNIGTC